MIESIIVDVQVFMAVFFVTIIAFSQSLYIMSNNNYDPKTAGTEDDERFIGSLMDSIFFAYRMSLGDFDMNELGSVHLALVQITCVLATLFLTIVMLNLLVAVISDTYARVEATSMNELYKTLADLICENEFLVPNGSLKEQDDLGDYLYIACVDSNNQDEEVWENKITVLKDKMMSKTVGIEKLMREAQKSLVKTISSQGEKFLSMLLESNIKNNMRLKQYAKKVDNLNSKKEEREHSLSPERGVGSGLNVLGKEAPFYGQFRIGEKSPERVHRRSTRPESRQAKKKNSRQEEEAKNTQGPYRRTTMKK